MCLIKSLWMHLQQQIPHNRENRIKDLKTCDKLVPVPVSARWQNNFPILSVLNDLMIPLLGFPFFYLFDFV